MTNTSKDDVIHLEGFVEKHGDSAMLNLFAKLIQPLRWLFSLPTGSIGQQISGLYMRYVVIVCSVGIAVALPYLVDHYLEYLIFTLSGEDARQEVEGAGLRIIIGLLYAFIFLLGYLAIQTVRFFYWDIFTLPTKEYQQRTDTLLYKLFLDIKRQENQDRQAHQAHQARHAKEQEVERTANTVYLTPEESVQVRKIRRWGRVYNCLSVAIGILVSVAAVEFLPIYLREHGSEMGDLMAQVTETLPSNMLLSGVMVAAVLFTLSVVQTKNLEKKIAGKRWKKEVRNDIVLTSEDQ